MKTPPNTYLLHLGANVKYNFELLQTLHVLASLNRKLTVSKHQTGPSYVYPPVTIDLQPLLL